VREGAADDYDPSVRSVGRCARRLLASIWRGGRLLEALSAFAVAALLYLVTEKLFVEAHEVPETPLSTTTLFAESLGLLLSDLVA
jgi:zinc transporter ZupT